MSDHGPKKHSIEQIIEHMTAERNVDGQYIPLGFAPPQTNANLPHWPEYNVNQNIHPQFIRNDTYDRNMHYGMDPAMMQSPSELQQTYFYHQQMLPESRLLDYTAGGGGCRYQPGVPFRTAQRNESELLPLGGFVPYHQADARDCGMFADAQRRVVPPTFHPAPAPPPPAMAVERPNTSARTTQTAPRPTEARPRAVAEVRPMRPSYSDVLASAPPAQPKPTQPAQPKTKGTTSKSSKTRKAAALKRQLSSGSEDAASGNGNGNGNGGRVPGTNPGTPRDSDAGFAATRKWSSLDGLDADSEQAFAPEEVGGTRGGKGKAKKQAGDWEGALNNRKPAGNAAAGKAGSGGQSTGGRRPLHINNNLLAGSNEWPAAADEKNLVKRPPCRTCADDKKGAGNSSGKSESKRPARSNSSSGQEGRRRGGGSGSGAGGGGRGKRRPSSSPLAALCRPMTAQLRRLAALAALALAWFLHLLSDVAGMSSRLAVHWCGQASSRLATTARSTLARATGLLSKLRVPARLSSLRLPWFRGAEPPAPEPRFERGGGLAGLETNMALPATGEEAMKRLLGCKGKDPYSILGVTPTCSDDDVKKYYKRQAFLVHPDKNGQPGAEEAFKILVHAFELIGEPERREAYERRVAETVQAEAAWSELSELLRALHQKMEYAANTIRCTNCGKRHRRVAAQRPCYAARSCAQCKIHHAAREGDIWAESTMLGLRWRYYACMDGAVFDITEWAACQHENLRHLKANTHAVQYRIVLGKQRPSRPARPENATGQTQGEPDLEDFLANLYSQGGVAGGGGGGATSEAKVDAARSRKKPRPRKK